jgi:hypothetical protein
LTSWLVESGRHSPRLAETRLERICEVQGVGAALLRREPIAFGGRAIRSAAVTGLQDRPLPSLEDGLPVFETARMRSFSLQNGSFTAP